eukprot:gene11093-12356_t
MPDSRSGSLALKRCKCSISINSYEMEFEGMWILFILLLFSTSVTAFRVSPLSYSATSPSPRWLAEISSSQNCTTATASPPQPVTAAKDPSTATSTSARLAKWWYQQSRDRKGLLIFLVPALVAQLQLLRATVPFFFDKFFTYCHPSIFLGIAALSTPQVVRAVRTGLWSCVGLGALGMVGDMLFASSAWTPWRPHTDSCALVLGVSTALGKELAMRLFRTGYSLVAVAEEEEALTAIREELLNFDSYENKASNSRGVSAHFLAVDRSNPLAAYSLLRGLQSLDLLDKIEVVVVCQDKVERTSIRRRVEGGLLSTSTFLAHLLPRMAKRASAQSNSRRAKFATKPRLLLVGDDDTTSSWLAKQLYEQTRNRSILLTLVNTGPFPTAPSPSAAARPVPVWMERLGIYPSLATTAERVLASLYAGRRQVCVGLGNRFYHNYLSRYLSESVAMPIVEKLKTMQQWPEGWMKQWQESWQRPVIDYQALQRSLWSRQDQPTAPPPPSPSAGDSSDQRTEAPISWEEEERMVRTFYRDMLLARDFADTQDGDDYFPSSRDGEEDEEESEGLQQTPPDGSLSADAVASEST